MLIIFKKKFSKMKFILIYNVLLSNMCIHDFCCILFSPHFFHLSFHFLSHHIIYHIIYHIFIYQSLSFSLSFYISLFSFHLYIPKIRCTFNIFLNKMLLNKYFFSHLNVHINCIIVNEDFYIIKIRLNYIFDLSNFSNS